MVSLQEVGVDAPDYKDGASHPNGGFLPDICSVFAVVVLVGFVADHLASALDDPPIAVLLVHHRQMGVVAGSSTC